jgi:two-component system response regulator TctD
MLLLIEDDATIARELVLRWQRRGWQPQCAGTLAEARRLLAQPGLVDLVVLDLGLPDGDGLDLLAELRRADTRLPVLVLTARDQVSDRVRGLRQGADDYLVKPFAVDELEARIEGLLRRAAGERRQRASFNELHWLGDEGRALLGDVPLELSPREFEVLGLLAGRAPRLLPKRVLVEALAGSNLELNDSAAELYISRLRRKLAGSSVAIQTLRGFGYMLVSASAGTNPEAGGDGSGATAADRRPGVR